MEALLRPLLRLSWSLPLMGLRQAGHALDLAACEDGVWPLQEALQDGLHGVAAALPRESGRLAWLELANKLEAFAWFQRAGAFAELHPGAPLPRLIDLAAGQGPYRGLWLVEGLGYRCAEEAWRGGTAPAGLLRGAAAGRLPARALLPLHTGLGLSLADRVVTPAAGSGLAAALRRFAALCRDNAREGCELAVFEALGLIVRNLHPARMAAVDRLVTEELGEDWAAAFWHGAGRGLYFAPTQLAPCFDPGRRGVEKALAEPPHRPGRDNAVAGYVWATALVNVRHPQVLAGLAGRLGGLLEPGAAFAHGATRAAAVWQHATGRPLPAPGGGEDPAGRRRRWIDEPCRDEVPALLRQLAAGRFGGLFLYQPPAAGSGPARPAAGELERR